MKHLIKKTCGLLALLACAGAGYCAYKRYSDTRVHWEVSEIAKGIFQCSYYVGDKKYMALADSADEALEKAKGYAASDEK